MLKAIKEFLFGPAPTPNVPVVELKPEVKVEVAPAPVVQAPVAEAKPAAPKKPRQRKPANKKKPVQKA